MAETTIKIHVTGIRRAIWRVKIGSALMRLARIIMGCNFDVIDHRL